jgi:hypothetical protein
VVVVAAKEAVEAVKEVVVAVIKGVADLFQTCRAGRATLPVLGEEMHRHHQRNS